MTRTSGRRLLTAIPFYLALTLLVVQAVGPVVWMLNSSVKDQNEFYTNTWGMSRTWLLSNYAEAWSTARVGDFAVNSVTVVLMALAILIVCSTLTAYALARLEFPGRDVIFWVVLATVMIPPDILIIPLFTLLRDLGLLGSHIGLALVYASGGFAFAVILMRGYFLTVPHELEEAAQIDGAGRLRRLWSVILPLCIPGMLIVIVLQSMTYYNDLYLAMVFLRNEANYTIPVGMLGFFEQYSINWPQFFAGLSIVTVPVVVLFTIAQRWFVQGMRAGGVK
jgi:ABC-type glycerol-3-phosphate transport system permease component